MLGSLVNINHGVAAASGALSLLDALFSSNGALNLTAQPQTFGELLANGQVAQDIQALAQNNGGILQPEQVLAATDELAFQSGEMLDKETLQQIDKILTNDVSQNAGEVIGGNLDEIRISTADAKEEIYSDENSSLFTNAPVQAATQGLIGDEGQKPTELKSEIIEVGSEYLKPTLKANELKVDERILGKDNLLNFVEEYKNDIHEKTINSDNLFSHKPSFNKEIADIETEKSNFSEQSIDKSSEANSLISKLDANQFGETKLRKNDLERAKDAYKSGEHQSYKIVNFTKNGNSLELSLEPASLGKVQVKLDYNADGKVNLIISADRQDTLDLLKGDSKNIQSILADNGLNSDGGSMNFNLNQDNSGQNNNSSAWNYFSAPVAFNFDSLFIDDAANRNQPLVSGLEDYYDNPYQNSAANGVLNMVV